MSTSSTTGGSAIGIGITASESSTTFHYSSMSINMVLLLSESASEGSRGTILVSYGGRLNSSTVFLPY